MQTTKTPDEIKKGLAACRDSMSVCDEVCSYVDVTSFPKCREMLLNDVFLFVRQLEEKIPKWTDVKERLPEEGQNVLVSVGRSIGISNIIGDDMVTGEPIWAYTGLGADPEYWMPLPETEEK